MTEFIDWKRVPLVPGSIFFLFFSPYQIHEADIPIDNITEIRINSTFSYDDYYYYDCKYIFLLEKALL